MGMGAASDHWACAQRVSVLAGYEELVESFRRGSRHSTLGGELLRRRLDRIVHRAGVAASSLGTGVVLGAYDAARAIDAGGGAADRAGPADDRISAGPAG